MTHEELQHQLESMPDKELAQIAREHLNELCRTGGRSFIMHVPPRVEDVDLIFAQLIKRFEDKTK